MLKTVEKKQHKKKKSSEWIVPVDWVILLFGEMSWLENMAGWQHAWTAGKGLCLFLYLPTTTNLFFFFLQCCWYGVLHYAIVLPLPSSENQHIPSLTSLSLPLSPSLPPSLTCPDINDTAIWGSGSSPALFPSCRLHSYTCTHSLTPNKILDTHPHTYTGHLQAHTHAHTYKNTTIHSKFISEAATDAFSLHTLI